MFFASYFLARLKRPTLRPTQTGSGATKTGRSQVLKDAGCRGAKISERGACQNLQVGWGVFFFHHQMSLFSFYPQLATLFKLFLCLLAEPHSVELKGVSPGLVGMSERTTGEGNASQLTRPRAFSQSAMHSLERGDRGNPQALSELAQVPQSQTAAEFAQTVFVRHLNICVLL